MSGPGVELDVIVTAAILMPHGYAFRREGNPAARVIGGLRPSGELLRCPCLAFVVRHPTAGVILIDTGMHAEATTSLRRDFGIPMSVMFRSLKPATAPFDSQLRDLDIDPADVASVLMTHLHVDHTSGMRLMPHAEFTCAHEEWRATRKRFASANGYVRHHLPEQSRMRLVDFARDGRPYGPFTSTLDLLGDASIRLVSTPGHTAGHMSVLLRLADGGQTLLVGDAAYTMRSIDEEVLPMLTHDDDASLRSMREIRAFSRSEREAILVPSHDPDAWRELSDVCVRAVGG